RAWAGLGIESVAAAASARVAILWVIGAKRILHPVSGGDVLVRAAHLHAACSANGGGFSRGRRNHGIRPKQLFLDFQIRLLVFCWGGVVPAVDQDEHAGMASQPINLITERLLCNLVIFGGPFCPMLPMITTTPARHDENTALIGEVEEFLGLELAFQADGIQPHVLDVVEFVAKAA